MALRDEYEGFIPSPQNKPEEPPVEEVAEAPVEPPVEEVATEPAVPSPVEQQVAALDIDIPAKPPAEVVIPEGSPVVEPEQPYTAFDEERARQTRIEALNAPKRVTYRDLSNVDPNVLRQYKGIVPGYQPLAKTSTPLGYVPQDAHLLLKPKEWRAAQVRREKEYREPLQFSDEQIRRDAETFRKTLNKRARDMFDWSWKNFPKEAQEALYTSAQSFRKVLSHDTPALIELGFTLRYYIGAHAHNIPAATNNLMTMVKNWNYERTADGINTLEGHLNLKPYEQTSSKKYMIYDENGDVIVDDDGNIEWVDWDAKARWEMEQTGISETLKAMGDIITQGVSVSEKDRDFLDRVLAYGIEIGTPLFILPWMGFARFGMAALGGNKALDSVMMNRFLNKKAKALSGGDDEYADVMVKMLRERMGKGKAGYDPKDSTSRVDLEYTKVDPNDPKSIERARENVEWVHRRDPEKGFWKKARDSFKIQDNLSRASSAGVYGAGSDLLLKEMFGADYQENYGFVPYIFAMAGYMRGGRDIERAAFRMPGAAYPFTGDFYTSLVTPRMAVGIPNAMIYNGIGMTLWAGQHIRTNMARTAAQIGDLRAPELKQKADWWGDKLERYQNSPMGKLMKYIAAGGDVVKGWAEFGEAVRTGNMDTFNRLTASLRASPKAVGRMAQSFRALAPEQQQAMITGHKQMMDLMQDMVTVHGPDGWDQQLLLINQMLGLKKLETMKNLALKDEWGKGFLSKVGLFAVGAGDLGLSKRSLLSRLDVLDEIYQKQIGLLATNLRQLKNSPGATEGKLKRLLETADRALITENRSYQQFLRKREALAKHMDKVKAGWPEERMRRFSEEAQEGGGLSWKKYDDNPASHARLTDEAVDDIVVARRKQYEVDALGSFGFSHQSMKQYARGFYKGIDEKQFMPANGFINDVSEDVISTNFAIMNMIGAETKIGAKKALVAYARRNYLDNIAASRDPVEMQKLLGEMSTILSMRKIQLRGVGEDQGKFFDDLIQTLNPDEQGAGALKGTLKVLTRLSVREGDEAGLEILNDILPSLLRIEDGHLLRMSAWGRVNDSGLTGYDLQRAYKDAFMTDRIFDRSLLDSEQALAVLTKIGKDPEKIKKQLKLREAAQEWYKTNIGEVWKSYLGKRMMPADREIMDSVTPPTVPERFTEFLLDERKIDGEIMGITMFNRIFPDGLGIVKLKTYDPITRAEGVTLTKKQKDLRNEAKKFIAHSLSLRIREEGPQFLEKVTENHWRALRQAGILEPEAVKQIIKYRDGVAELANKGIPEDIKFLYKRINDNLKTLDAMEVKRLRENFSSVILPGGGISTESIVRSLFDADFAKGLKFSVHEVGHEVGQLIEATRNVRNLQEKRGAGATREVDEAVEAFEGSQRGLTKELWEKPIDILLDAVKDTPSLIDDIEDLIFDYIHRNSIVYTETRRPILGKYGAKDKGMDQVPISPVAEASEEAAEQLAKQGFPGAVTPYHSQVARTAKVDFDKLEQNLIKAIPILQRIYTFRMNRGGPKMIAQANRGFQALEKVNQLQKIYNYAVVTQGKALTGLGIANYPKVLGRKQLGGRLYNWARGFVHPGYLVAESTFMRLGMGEAKLIGDIVFDPKAIDIVHAAVAEGKQITLNQLSYLMNLAKMAVRGPRAMAGERKETKATLADMSDFYIHFTGSLPPAYKKRQERFEAHRQLDLRLKGLRSRGQPRMPDPAHLSPLFGL